MFEGEEIYLQFRTNVAWLSINVKTWTFYFQYKVKRGTSHLTFDDKEDYFQSKVKMREVLLSINIKTWKKLSI